MLHAALEPALGDKRSAGDLQLIATVITGGAFAVLSAWSDGRLDVSVEHGVDRVLEQIRAWLAPGAVE